LGEDDRGTGSERFERAGFLREKGVCAGSFYHWRRRLRTIGDPVGFALIEQNSAGLRSASGTDLRRRRAAANFQGRDVAILQLVLAALRA